jgi:hypothetical protein
VEGHDSRASSDELESDGRSWHVDSPPVATGSTVGGATLRSWLRRPETWVLVVAVIYALLQLLLLDSERFLSWDEAVYTSQMSPFADAASMGPHRARGVTLIVAPVALLTDSMLPLRIYLAVVSGAALFGAFVIWCRSIRFGAPIAAGLFASSWVAIYYGSAVYPNLYSALVAVAAIGLTLRAANSEKRADLYLLGALMAMAMLLRPSEAVIVGVCVIMVALVEKSDRWLGLSTAALAGLALGALPWLIEAFVRFDGPLQRLEAASDVVGAGLHNNLTDYLRSLDGSADAISGWAILWLGLLLVLGLVGLLRREPRIRQISAVTLVGAFLLVASYLFATKPVEVRYMLSGYALLCICSALGLITVVVRFDSQVLAAVSIASVMLLVTAWNFQALRAWDDRQVENASTALALGQSLKARAESNECFFLSSFNYPAISFASGCPGGLLGENADENRRRLEAGTADAEVFALTRNPDVSAILGDGWRCDPVAALAERGWQICTRIA